MKKLLITLLLASASIIGFSQTVIIDKGKAVEVVPEKKTEFTQEQILDKLSHLKRIKERNEAELIRIQAELLNINDDIEMYEGVCRSLGYIE